MADYSDADIDAALERVQQKTANTAAINVSAASGQNPDIASRNTQLAKKFGVTPDVISTYPEEFLARHAAMEAQVALKNAPATADALAQSPGTTAIVGPDVTHMANVESLSSRLGKALDYAVGSSRDPDAHSMAGDIAKEAYAHLENASTWAAFMLSTPFARASDAVTGNDLTSGLNQYFMERWQNVDAINEDVRKGGMASRLAGSAGGLLADLPFMIATGGTNIVRQGIVPVAEYMTAAMAHGAKGMAVPATVGGLDTAKQVYEQTGDIGLAMKAAAADYAVSSAFGGLPMSVPGNIMRSGVPWYKAISPVDAFKVAGGGAALNVGHGEINREVMNQVLPDSMHRNFDINELPEQALQGSLMGVIMGPRHEENVFAKVAQHNDDMQKREQAMQDYGNLTKISSILSMDKLRERDQETFMQLVRNIQDTHQVSDVYVPLDKLSRALEEHGIKPDELQQSMPDVAKQVKEAHETGGDVKIPLDQFFAQVLPTDVGKSILDHVKVSPDGMSMEQAKEHMANEHAINTALAEKLSEGVTDGMQNRKDDRDLLARTYRELRSTGLFSNENARTYAGMHLALMRALSAHPDLRGMSIGDIEAKYGKRTFAGRIMQANKDHLDQSLRDFMAEHGIEYGATHEQRGAIARDMQFNDRGEQDGMPTFGNDNVKLANPRDVSGGHDVAYVAPEGHRALKYDILNADNKPVGHTVLEVGPDNQVTRLLNIKVDENERQKGIGERVVGGLTHATGELGIWHPVDHAREWWENRGAELGTTDGSIGWDNFVDGRAGRENQGGLGSDVAFAQSAVPHETDADKSNSLSDARVSPRMPTAVKASEDSMGETRLQPDLNTAKRDPVAFLHNIDLMSLYPNFDGITGTPDQRAEVIIQHAVDNLLWLHDHWKPGYRERSRMWYVGGNRIAHRWAKRFGVSPEQVAAVIAATSPQKDWFQNVSLAERILEAVINNSNVPWDSKMSELVRTRDWGPKAVPDPSVYEGKTLRDLYSSGTPGSLLDMAIWIRAWDEANNPMKARVITPEGGFTSQYDKGKGGKDIGLRWQSFPTIVKTLQVLMSNDRATLSNIIGANHKVRSFFNNIIAPYAGEDVTIDTHAVAAALLRPLGSSSIEVAHNFGSNEPGSPGPKNSAITGLYGTYPIFAEAYRRAARERNILPREMQSITWEAVRGLFRPEQKNDRVKAQSDAIWRQVAAGEIDANEARESISKLVGGIQDPPWVRSPAGTDEAATDTSYEKTVSSTRGAEGSSDAGRGVDASAPVQQDRGSEFAQSGRGLDTSDHGLRNLGLNGEEAARVANNKPITYQTHVDVDGVQRHALNSNGKPIAQTEEGVRNFWRWFGDSKVVDAEGKPLVVYHGTNKDISKFKPGRGGGAIWFSSTPELSNLFVAGGRRSMGDGAKAGSAVYPSYLSLQKPLDLGRASPQDNLSVAQVLRLAGLPDDDQALRSIAQANLDSGYAFVSPSNKDPAGYLSNEYSRLNARASNTLDDPGLMSSLRAAGFDGLKMLEEGVPTLAAFRPEQIKSATGNNGEFNPNNPSILKQDEGTGQRGAYNPKTKQISFTPNADLSTFVHEMGHSMLDMYMDIAKEAEHAGIRGDMDSLLKNFGIDGATAEERIAKWHGMSLDEQRPHHEQFAEWMEQYILTGKAPDQKLQPLFARLRDMMMTVYKHISEIGTPMSAEVKQVFDRMFATDAAIKQAETARQFDPLFTEKPEQMNDAEWQDYQQKQQDSRDHAMATMQARMMGDMKYMSRAQSRALREEQSRVAGLRSEAKKDAEKEVGAQRVYRLDDFLRDGKLDAQPGESNAQRKRRENVLLGSHKIDNDMLKEIANKDGNAHWQVLDKRYAEKGGLDPEVIADLFGYSSADAMVRDLVEMRPREDMVNDVTDHMMMAEHGDISSPQAMQEAADAAIHNKIAARIIATQLKAVTNSGLSATALLNGAREAARAAIGAKIVKDLISRALLKQYQSAERKANVASLKALAKDPAETGRLQRASLLNNQLVDQVHKAQQEVTKGIQYLKKFSKDNIRKALDGGDLAQIDALLAQYNFTQAGPADPNKRVIALQQWMESQADAGYEPVIDAGVLGNTQQMHYKDMSMDEFRALVSTVKSIEHIAREKNKIRTVDGAISLRDAVDRLKEKMDARGEKFSKADLLEPPKADVDGLMKATFYKLGVAIRRVHATLLGQEFKINRYDLHDILGPFRELILDKIFDGNYAKMDMMKEQSNFAVEMGKKLGKEWQESLTDMVTNNHLVDPDLTDNPAQPVMMKMTRGRMLAIARHVGNESNFDKLSRGYGWEPGTIWKFLHENMNAKDWEATQAHWDSFNPLWEKSVDLITRLGGVPPPKVEERPFRTKFGHMEGGYSPIDYDPLRSKLSIKFGEHDNDVGDKVGSSRAYKATVTSNGSMIKRSEYADRVSLDFHSVDARVRDTIHDLAYRESLLDARKIYQDPEFRQKFLQTYGREEYAAMGKWLENIANMYTEQPNLVGLRKALNYVRQGLVINGIGYRISTVAKHGGAAALKTLGYLGNGAGAAYFGQRLVRMTSGHLKEDIESAQEKFPEIRARMMQMDRDFKEGNRSMYEAEDWRQKNERFGHAMVAWSDALSAIPTAWAAYDLAISDGVPKSMGGTGVPMTEAQAVAYANSVVRQAHGSALESARSNILNEKDMFIRAYTTLFGFMNNSYGQTADMLDKAFSGGNWRNHPALVARLMSTMIIPAIWTQWLKDDGPGNDENSTWWAAKAIMGEIGSTVPGMRDAVSLLERGKMPDNAFVSPFLDLYKLGDDVSKIREGKHARIYQDLADTIGTWGHIAGLGQVGHIVQYIMDAKEGRHQEDQDHPVDEIKHAVVGGARPKH